MRQTILLGVGVAVIVLGYLLVENYHQPVVYEREHIEQEEVEEVITEPEYPEEWLKEAEAAAEAVIQKRKLEAERAELIEQRDEVQSRINEIEKELGAHWKDPANVRRLIRETFPENPQLAVAIAMGESELNPGAYNPEAHRGCNGSYGIMQIACVHVDDTRKLFDPEYNLKVARRIYDAEGWQPWGAYTDGSYLKHLARR